MEYGSKAIKHWCVAKRKISLPNIPKIIISHPGVFTYVLGIVLSALVSFDSTNTLWDGQYIADEETGSEQLKICQCQAVSGEAGIEPPA